MAPAHGGDRPRGIGPSVGRIEELRGTPIGVRAASGTVSRGAAGINAAETEPAVGKVTKIGAVARVAAGGACFLGEGVKTAGGTAGTGSHGTGAEAAGRGGSGGTGSRTMPDLAAVLRHGRAAKGSLRASIGRVATGRGSATGGCAAGALPGSSGAVKAAVAGSSAAAGGCTACGWAAAIFASADGDAVGALG